MLNKLILVLKFGSWGHTKGRNASLEDCCEHVVFFIISLVDTAQEGFLMIGL